MRGSGGSGTIDTTGGNIGLSGNLTGTGGLTKVGPGTLTLGGGNTYAGPTTVSGGVLSAGAVNTFSPNSDPTINGGTLDATGFAQTVKSLTVGSLGTLNLSVGNVLTSTNFGSLSGTLNLFGTTSGSVELISFPASYNGELLDGQRPPGLHAGVQPDTTRSDLGGDRPQHLDVAVQRKLEHGE